jgi:hypothetical protein
MKDLTFELECKECNGVGSFEYGPECSKPASNCCGGCYKTVQCSACEGNKTYSVTYTIDELKEIIQLHVSGELVDAHELVMSNL